MRTIALATVVCGALAILVPVVPGPPGRQSLLVVVFAATGLASLALVYGGRTQFSAQFLASGLWLGVTCALFTGRVVGDQAFFTYVVVVLAGGLMLGARVALWIAGASVASGLTLAMAHTSGWMVEPAYTVSPYRAWLNGSAVLIVAWLLLRAATTKVSAALDRASRELEERRQAETELRRERALSSRIVETSPMGILVLDRSGRIVSANTYVERVLGAPVKAMLGRCYDAREWPITDLAGRPLEDHELPYQRVVASGHPVQGMHHAIAQPGGGRAFLSTNAAPLWTDDGEFDGLIAVIEDISEQRRGELALLESEERFRRLSDATFEGVGITDQGRVLDANRRLVRMLGFDHESELVGRSVADFVAPESGQALAEQQLLHSDEPHEYVAVRKDGTRFPVESRARELPYQGRTVRVAAIRDITERRRTDELLLTIAEGVASATGGSFFRSLVKHLADRPRGGLRPGGDAHGRRPPRPHGGALCRRRQRRERRVRDRGHAVCPGDRPGPGRLPGRRPGPVPRR